ncbi:Lrp/AsnC family transcriptional regulator [Reinekea sp.]|jgi:Lrp/AsnC family leucine-responsive transcriptional regulator|uniref:Lrp/AsnC family transcriptional regulator n=1 Tax=Reinekea sp. TaxID=1970455 RepID=UPI00398922A8
MKLDRIDRQLLSLLQKDARATAAELAEKVGLSASPCARRIRQLEQSGLITGLHARLSREKLGLSITVFVHVRLSQHQEPVVVSFEKAVETMSEVISCYTVSGSFDYLLHVVVKDLVAYENWVKRLQRLSMVNTIDSSFAIRSVKEFAPLDVQSS